MKFGIYATIAGLVSGQELLIPVTGEGCGFTFLECDKARADTSKYWDMDVTGTTCDENPLKRGDDVEIDLKGTGVSDFKIV